MAALNGNEVGMHSHTVFSDGTESIIKLFSRARHEGIRALCKTDHDTMAGANEASQIAAELGIDTMLATEISAFFRTRHGNILYVHILGYGFESGRIDEVESWLAPNREAVNDLSRSLLSRINAGMGLKLKMGDVRAITGARGPCVYPMQIIHAAAVLSHRNIEEIRQEHLQQNGLLATEDFFIDERVLDVFSAVEIVRSCGGKSVLAHPGLLCSMRLGSCEHAYEEFLDLLSLLTDQGLSGIETFHPCHTDCQQDLFGRIAKRFGLKQTAGSDSHGAYRDYPLGMPGMSYREFQAFKTFCQNE